MKKYLIIIITIIILAVILGGGYYIYSKLEQQKPVACTTEAKICPDGSSVGRTGPNCEFASCSNPSSLTLNQLENASYDVSSEGLYFSTGMFGPQDKNFNPKALKLVNGLYSFGPEHKVLPSQCTENVTHSVSIKKNSDGSPMVAFGDLNGDGVSDAVVMLNLTYEENNQTGPHDYCSPDGKTSSSDSEPMLVVFINKNNQPMQVDQYMGRSVGTSDYKIEDMENLKIQGSIINLTEKSAQEVYKLVSNKLVKVGPSFVASNIPADWKTYTNNNLGITFQYPDSANLSVNDSVAAQKELQTKEGDVSVSVDSKDFKSCVQFDVVIPTEIIVNQTPFYQTKEGDAAMGTYHTEIQYATVKDGKCYSINLQYFTHNCSNYLPLEQGNTQQAQGYNKCLADNKSATALEDVLNGIMSTFKFNN